MISLRIRRQGATDWTYVFFSGEEDEHLLMILASRAWSNDFIVEIQTEAGAEWIPLEEWEE